MVEEQAARGASCRQQSVRRKSTLKCSSLVVYSGLTRIAQNTCPPHCAFSSDANSSILLVRKDGDEFHLIWLQRIQTVAAQYVWQRCITVSMDVLRGDHSDEAVSTQVVSGPEGEKKLHGLYESYGAKYKMMKSYIDIIRKATAAAVVKYEDKLRDCYWRVPGRHSIHKWRDHVLKAERETAFSADDMRAALDGKYDVPVSDETHYDTPSPS